MNKIRLLFAVLIAVLIFSLVDVNAQNASPAVSFDIAKQVAKNIRKLPRYEVFDYIDFTVDGSVVTLNGKVINAINKSDAEGYVGRIPGVTRVINNIELLPVGSFDNTVRQNLYTTIHNWGGLSRYLWDVNPDVRLIVENGNVTLEGTVYNETDRNTMNIMANSVFGVFSVMNNLKVGSVNAR